MTKVIKRHFRQLLAAAFVLGITVFAVVTFGAGGGQDLPARELILTTKGIVFLSPDQPGKANPVLTLKRGTPVKLVLRNEEPGSILHCFTIGGLNVKSSRILPAGASETITFTPKDRGTFAYACLLHPSMGGKVVVE